MKKLLLYITILVGISLITIGISTKGTNQNETQNRNKGTIEMATPSLPFYNAVVEDSQRRTAAPAPLILPNAGTGTAGQQQQQQSSAPAGPTAAQIAAAQQVALFDQSINNTQAGINRLGTERDSSYSTVDASWQDALNQLLLGKNQANETYTGNKKTAATDYVGAKNTITSQAGSSLTGLLRLLGSRGAGGGTAYRTTAPGAVARDATIKRTDAGNTFGANNQALDTNWNTYLTDYNNQVSSANAQRERERGNINNAIETRRATLLQTLAQLQAQRATAAGGNPVAAAQPYLDQANNVLNSVANYRVNPITYQTQAYKAPELSSYSFNPTTPTYQGQRQANDYTSPYLAALLGKKQQQPTVA